MGDFNEEMVQKVWEKGKVDWSRDPNVWRKDDCTAWIKRSDYGNQNSINGWQIDHISPGGSDELSNLRPLQWKNNLDKSDGKLKCNVRSVGTDNVET